jgi:hypothetical protein
MEVPQLPNRLRPSADQATELSLDRPVIGAFRSV